MSIWLIVWLWLTCGIGTVVIALILDINNGYKLSSQFRSKRDCTDALKIIVLGPIGTLAAIWQIIRSA